MVIKNAQEADSPVLTVTFGYLTRLQLVTAKVALVGGNVEGLDRDTLQPDALLAHLMEGSDEGVDSPTLAGAVMMQEAGIKVGFFFV